MYPKSNPLFRPLLPMNAGQWSVLPPDLLPDVLPVLELERTMEQERGAQQEGFEPLWQSPTAPHHSSPPSSAGHRYAS